MLVRAEGVKEEEREGGREGREKEGQREDMDVRQRRPLRSAKSHGYYSHLEKGDKVDKPRLVRGSGHELRLHDSVAPEARLAPVLARAAPLHVKPIHNRFTVGVDLRG